jgi:FkbM family methyltransferase
LHHSIGKVSAPYLTKSALKRSFAQQGEDLILDRVLTRVLHKDIFKPHTYVDVGAYDAIDSSVTYLLYLRGWNGVVFDPSSFTQKSFKRWRKRDVFVDAVVGNEDGVDVDFYIPKYSLSDQSSVSTKYPNLEKIDGFDKLVFRQVNLNSELRRQGLSKIDVLNIDVEGAELEILKNLDFDFFKPSVIAVEIHGNDLEECLKSDEARLIISKGYQFVGSAVITQFLARKDEIRV